jgi:Gram-negative bacterial TonB protein C-terminal
MKLLFSILFSHLTLISYCQFYTVKGKVLDVSGNSISYATIESAKTHETYICDRDGAFSFTTPYKYDTLICSHIAFQKQIEILSKNDTVNFIMSPDVSVSYKIQIQTSDAKKNSKEEDKSLIKQWLKQEEEEKRLADYDPFYLSECIPAKYPKGEDQFKIDFEKLYDSLNYPQFEGAIKVGLLIDQSGTITAIKLIKGISTTVDNAVINTIKNMHRWNPSIQNGRNVTFYLEIQIEHL